MSSPIITDDCLSLLPDELLHHVLSFLPDSYEAARTSVLSSRFRRIWAHLPSIRLPLSASTASYRRHVERCLSSHNLPLLLSLDLSLVSSRSAHRWIHKVSTRSPSLSFLRISARFVDRDSVSFPRPVFACRNLVSLEIESIPFPSLPSSFHGFPSLTNLKLNNSDISNQSLDSFLSKSPSLISLTLIRCYSQFYLDISSTKLTHLNIFECELETHLIEKLRIKAPNLTSISYTGDVYSLYLDNACQLLDADISHCFGSCPTQSEWARAVIDLRHVSNKLQVDDWFFKYVMPDTVPKPMFNNLKVLHCWVKQINPPLLDGLVSILGHCSILEQLIVDMSTGRQDRHPYFSPTDCLEPDWPMEQRLEEKKEIQVWDPPQKKNNKYDSRRDLARNLKNVTVNCFTGTPNEMKMLEYLLGKACVLEKLIIGDCMFRSLKEICLLFARIPRASSHLQICQLKTTL